MVWPFSTTPLRPGRSGRTDATRAPEQRAAYHAWIENPAAPAPGAFQQLLLANAEVRLHAAVVFAAIGVVDQAATELDAALKLDPSLAGSDEVKALKAKLGRK